MPNKKYTGIMPKPRPTYANPRHPMNTEGLSLVERVPAVKAPKPRPKRVYNGQTGMYSTD